MKVRNCNKMSSGLKAELDRKGTVARIRCPHCCEWIELPGYASIEIFVCPICEEASEVEEKPN